MKALALAVVVLIASIVSAEAQRPNCKDTYVHQSAPGQVDNGTTVALPNGGFQTTYADGWIHNSEPDSSYGAGGRQMVDKDNQGRVRTVTKCDPKNIARQETESEYQNSLIIMTVTKWNAAGVQTGRDITRMAAGNPTPATPAPSPQGQQAQPTQPPPGNQNAGGPPPGDQGTGGPPPGYDQGSNGPPPGYDQGGPPPPGGAGFGGIGFGFGFGRRF
ncbi:MAG TPA: hypothetical protein VN823_18030 [Stellaceae bacterium]|nr:hypothetical protein [Stellaceae bacterium]